MEEYEIADDLCGSLRELTPLEFDQLEANCISDGRIIDPIVAWDGFLLDGRYRLRIAKKNDLPYEVVEMDFNDRDEARRWVAKHQIGKRNVTETEAQRLRAQLAEELGDTAAVAELHGVSRRKVQRDVEAENARKLMTPEVLERCNRGEIINRRSDWQDYGKLTPSQRAATDRALSDNPSITLRQAMPMASRAALTAADFVQINASPLSAQQKQSLSIGTLKASSKDVQKFCALKPEDQELAAIMLDDDEVDDLGDAVRRLRGGPKVVSDESRIAGKKKEVEKLLMKLLSLMDDLRAIIGEGEGHQACVEAIKSASLTIEEWK